MKTRSLILTAGLALGFVGIACSPARAQDDDPKLDRNRLWLNAQFAFNVSARFQSVSAPTPASPFDVEDNLEAGFDLMYGRVLGYFRLSETREAAWGISGGFTSLDILIEETDPNSGVEAEIDTLAVGMKLGPFLELPLSRRFTVSLGAGMAAVDVLNTMRYDGDEFDEDEWLFGGYAQATLSYALNYGLSVFAGMQYQYLGEASVSGGGRKAVLDLEGTYGAVVGLRGSF